MSLDVYFRADLANVIGGLALSADEIGDLERRAGYLAALRAVSVSLGIVELPALPVSHRHTLSGREHVGCGVGESVTYGALLSEKD